MEGVYPDLLSPANTDAYVEPNFKPTEALRIDGVVIDYPVVAMNFTPSSDVYSEDTGQGIIQIAWPELESSGTLNLVIEDIPSSELASFKSLLNEVKTYRWLSFRGKRYRIFGITATYSPYTHTRYYRAEISCVAYRPHKTLPPVPGTKVFPLADVTRYGGKEADDVILSVGGYGDWVVIITTAGVCFWNKDTGERKVFEDEIVNGGLVSYYDDAFYVSYQKKNNTLFRKFVPDNITHIYPYLGVSIPFNPSVYLIQNDVFYFVMDGTLHVYPYNKLRASPVEKAPSGLRVNHSHYPFWLYSGQTDFPSTVQNVSTDIFSVVPSGDTKAIVTKSDGIYVYPISKTDTGYYLNSGDFTPYKISSHTEITKFGSFGSPGYPEGYWYVEKEKVINEDFITTSLNTDTQLIHSKYETKLITDVSTINGLVLENNKLHVDYDNDHVGGYFMSEEINLKHLNTLYYIDFFWEATIPEDTVLIWSYSINGGVQEVFYRSDIHGTNINNKQIAQLSTHPDLQNVKFMCQFVGDTSLADITLEYYSAHFKTERVINTLYTDNNTNGILEADFVYGVAGLVSVYSDNPVSWPDLKGIYYNGEEYLPYTDRHIFRVYPLL